MQNIESTLRRSSGDVHLGNAGLVAIARAMTPKSSGANSRANTATFIMPRHLTATRAAISRAAPSARRYLIAKEGFDMVNFHDFRIKREPFC
jgi:hypothetical protein